MSGRECKDDDEPWSIIYRLIVDLMDKRVKFDFEIDFSNGGGLQGQGFRLDITDDDISDEE